MIRIGKIVATHGLQGALVMTHIIGSAQWLKKGMPLFLELHKESYIPFFTEQYKAHNDDEFVIHLEDVCTMEAARKLIGKHVYVQEDIVEPYLTDSPLLWLGFQVIDEVQGTLGKVDDIISTPTQWLAKMLYRNAEVLIPLVPELIKKVNIQKKTIHLMLPEGLLEVYTDK
jgi:16S rRNA processing protein RimM